MDIIYIKIIIFAVITAGNAFKSRVPLRNPHSHGFFRFFAFEFILIMILLNAEQWFTNPFSALQIVSWLFLLASIILAAHGFYLLHEIGKPKEGIEDTANLVTIGAYRYIRHPLYTSLLLLGWGVFFKNPSIISGILLVLISIFLIMTARTEEAENLYRFGNEYAVYMKKTKMFIPFLF